MKSVIAYIPLLILCLISCKKEVKEDATLKEKQPSVTWQAYDETEDIQATQELEQTRMHLKLINSKVYDKNLVWKSIEKDLLYFSEDDYERLKDLILEKTIPELQSQVKSGLLTYEELTQFYLYRIRKYESDNAISLNAVISLNPKVVEQARTLDQKGTENIDIYSLSGMPILIKDNIGTKVLPTTAGALALKDNETENAFIVNKILGEGALLLGKANLSEWAYFLCQGCPVGYSAIGGQTINPYGRLIFETGGSSSGSGVAIAANFCAAAVGTETSGSILSPSSQNAVVGLKPTIGVLSRSGIVPISSTLDTPGPMTRSVIDNAILFQAMLGKDVTDEASIMVGGDFINATLAGKIEGKRFGVIKEFLKDSLYARAVEDLKNNGALVFEFEPEQTPLPKFLSILNMDMKKDLPAYLKKYASPNIKVSDVDEVIAFNKEDTLNRIPYGQAIFEGILLDETSDEELDKIKNDLNSAAREYFDKMIKEYSLSAVLSINNYHAGYAAVAKYPAITVPMGFTVEGEPKGLTFISKPFSETNLLKMAYAYETLSKRRRAPENYN